MESKELASGTILQSGKYTIERIIGSGGFGITYYARHNVFGRYYAIKEFFISGYCVRNSQNRTVMLQGMSQDFFDKYLQKFINEASTLSHLNHPNIVKVADIFRENGTAYIVMNHVEGQTLQQIVENKGKLDYATAVNYIAQIAEAVNYIHTQNVLHRDIKPDNIIITPDNRAILIDFGSAREFDNDPNATKAILTPGYAPPEQYAAISKKGPYSDVYSLGATLYFVLTGQKPMDAATRTMEQIEMPQNIVPSITDKANRTIMKAMELKPENRHQKVLDFLNDLLSAQNTVNGRIPDREKYTQEPVIQPIREEKTKTNKSKTGLIISICFIVLAAFTIYLLHENIQGEKRIERDVYNNVLSSNSIEMCDEYLAKYPNSKYRYEVDNKKRKI
jgi:serine/threonine-protein kinase